MKEQFKIIKLKTRNELGTIDWTKRKLEINENYEKNRIRQ